MIVSHIMSMPTRTMRTLLTVAALMLLVVACDDGPDTASGSTDADADADVAAEEQDVAEEDADGEFHSSGAWIGGDVLPEAFPAEIPLPDDYVIVSNASEIWEGDLIITLRIAVPGSEEEQLAFYEEIIQAEFEGVEFVEHPSDSSAGWTFDRGLGFEHGFLDISTNHGESGTDPSHHPVILFIQLSERAASD